MGNQKFSLEPCNDYTMSIDAGTRLDNNNAHDLVETLNLVQSNGYRYAIIDMKRLTFISSAGVGSILGSVDMYRSTGGDIILCNIPQEILHILRVLDLTEYLTIKGNAEDAVQFCRIETH